MIIKKITRSSSGSDTFHRLASYILTDGQTSFRNLATYLADDQGRAGERVLYSRVSNCATADPEWAIMEIEATQLSNTRSLADKSYHLVVSFREDERVDRATLEAIEDAICEHLGFGEHQRVSAVHRDTDNLHIHLAINKIHPETLTIHDPYRDAYALSDIAQVLEARFDLEKDNHVGIQVREAAPRQPGKAGDLEAHTGLVSLASWAQAHLLPRIEGSDGWQAIHAACADLGLRLVEKGNGLALVGDRTAIKASSVSRSFSKGALEQRFGAYAKAGPAIAAIEPTRVYSPQPSVAQQRVEAQALPDQGQAKEPVKGQATDRTSANEGLTVASGQAAWLEDKHSLYARYRTQAAETKAQRTAGFAEIRARQKAGRAAIKATFQARRRQLQSSGLPPRRRKSTYAILRVERLRALQTLQGEIEKARRGVRREHPVPTWPGFLQQAAEAGDRTALRCLQARCKRAGEQAVSQTPTISEIMTNALYSDSPIPDIPARPDYRVHKNGDVSFALASGSRVRDTQRGLVLLDKETQETVAELVALATLKYGGHLTVSGSASFCAMVAMSAGRQGVTVTRADPPARAIDPSASRELLGTRDTPEAPWSALDPEQVGVFREPALAPGLEPVLEPSPDPERPATPTHAALDAKTWRAAITAYLAERNARVGTVADLTHHRLFAAEDAGTFTYQGTRNLRSGHTVALFQAGEGTDMLVMPLSASQARKLRDARIGADITLSRDARVLGVGRAPGRDDELER